MYPKCSFVLAPAKTNEDGRSTYTILLHFIFTGSGVLMVLSLLGDQVISAYFAIWRVAMEGQLWRGNYGG